MKVNYSAMRPRDSVWMRTTVEPTGVWHIIVGQVEMVTEHSVMLKDCTTFSYKLSKGPDTSPSRDGVIWTADRIETIFTLGS